MERAGEPGRAHECAAYRVLLRHRPEGTTCPSEAARVVGGEAWHGLSAEVRDLAWDLADQGVVRVLQKGEEVERGRPTR